jgi:hypothetical protein
MGNTSENPVRNHYLHAPERLQEHKADLADQAKNPQTPRVGNGEKVVPMQTIVFERRHITLLNKALRDPSHRLRDAALELMQGFTRAAERDEITTLNRASIEYHIPVKNLSDWVAKGVIPYENKDEYAIYVRRDVLDKVAPVYHQAKEQRKLAAPILKKMRDQLFPDSATSSQK